MRFLIATLKYLTTFIVSVLVFGPYSIIAYWEAYDSGLFFVYPSALTLVYVFLISAFATGPVIFKKREHIALMLIAKSIALLSVAPLILSERVLSTILLGALSGLGLWAWGFWKPGLWRRALFLPFAIPLLLSTLFWIAPNIFVSITMDKTAYNEGETVIIKISGLLPAGYYHLYFRPDTKRELQTPPFETERRPIFFKKESPNPITRTWRTLPSSTVTMSYTLGEDVKADMCAGGDICFGTAPIVDGHHGVDVYVPNPFNPYRSINFKINSINVTPNNASTLLKTP